MKKIEKQIELIYPQPQQRRNLRIWCEGHLPIREIIADPGERQREMKESLEYYKDTVYWLRYVDIRNSDIPLRN